WPWPEAVRRSQHPRPPCPCERHDRTGPVPKPRTDWPDPGPLLGETIVLGAFDNFFSHGGAQFVPCFRVARIGDAGNHAGLGVLSCHLQEANAVIGEEIREYVSSSRRGRGVLVWVG